MIALTQEEWEQLRICALDCDNDILDSGDAVGVERILNALTIRGCCVRVDVNDDEWECKWFITPLGRLALRVSRPEMAFTI